MKTVCSIVKIIETVMRAIVAVVAVIIILFAAYSLYDTFYINQHAFSSYELKQYKPMPVEVNDNSGKRNGDGSGTDYDEDSFTRLKEVNEDARGWLSVNDTNIDYPVVQGEDDLEYASKDIFGNTSITGAIYLMTDNAGDFSDPYNVIFGHHMDNGAMFGDLEKYKDKEYFESHKTGWLYANGRYYRLDVFAVMMTDAYNKNVYDKDALTIKERINYILSNSEYYKLLSDSDKEALERFEKEGVKVLDELQKSGDPALVLALSTCESAITNGRIVVFFKATPVDAKDLPGFNNNGGGENGGNSDNTPETPSVIDKLTAIGHPFGSDNCYSGADAMAIIKYGDKIKAKLKRFRLRVNTGTAIEIFILVSSVLSFFLTEDMTTPVVMCDKYTPLMIAISALMFVIDVICFVYRDMRILTPEEVAQMRRPEGTTNGN